MAAKSIQPIPVGAYVYEIIVDGLVRYIGKGTGTRFRDHIRTANRINRRLDIGKKARRSLFYAKLAGAIRDGSVVEYCIARDGMTDAAAFALEVEMIAVSPSGQLWNATEGGNGQSSAFSKMIWADEKRLALASEKARTAWEKNPEWRVARFSDPLARQKQSEMVRTKWENPDYRAMQTAAHSKPRPQCRGVPVPALSAPAKQRWANPEFKASVADAIKLGMASPEVRNKLKAAAEKRWSDPQYRENRRLAKLARKELTK